MYVPNVYEVSFDPNGGTMTVYNDYKLSVTYGQQYGVLPEINHPEYVFDGWYLNNDIILSSTYVSYLGNHTLCAHWNEITDEEILNDINNWLNDNYALSDSINEDDDTNDLDDLDDLESLLESVSEDNEENQHSSNFN